MRTRSVARLASLPMALLLAHAAVIARAQGASVPSEVGARQSSIPLLSPEQMTPGDRAVAQSWQQTVAQSAQFYGYTLDLSYAYREIACPVAPNHLLLAYEATSPNGSVSRFTAVVHRGAEEQAAGRHPVAQIIPILNFGVTPFVQAIANPHSIEIFNSAVSAAPVGAAVLVEMRAGNDPVLLRGLCYLAMVGEEPVALRSPSLETATIHAPVPTLQFLNKGKTRQLISIRNSATTYQLWALNFSSQGRLVSATRQEHPIDTTTPLMEAANPRSPTRPAVSASVKPVSAQPSAEPPSSAPSTPMQATPAVSTVTAATAESPQPLPPSATPVRPATPEFPAPTSSSATAEPPQPATTPTSPATAAIPASPAPISTASTAEPPQPATTPTSPATAAIPTSPAPTSAAATAEPPQPVTSPASPPAAAMPASPAPAPTAATAQPPQPAAPVLSPPVVTVPASSAPTTAAIAPSSVVFTTLPQPPGRFISNPPLPPRKFIPASALQVPPHLPQ